MSKEYYSLKNKNLQRTILKEMDKIMGLEINE